MDFGFWITADVTKLGASKRISNVGSLNEEVPCANLQLFKHDVAACVQREFTDFSVFPVVSLSDSGVADGTIAPLERLNAFLDAIISFHRAQSSKKDGAHCQKLCNETFSAFLPIAFVIQTQKNGVHVEGWCREERTGSTLSIHAPQNLGSCPF